MAGRTFPTFVFQATRTLGAIVGIAGISLAQISWISKNAFFRAAGSRLLIRRLVSWSISVSQADCGCGTEPRGAHSGRVGEGRP